MTTPVAPMASHLVVRSVVPANLPYQDYKPYLRRDFEFSCAYCTMSEAEASGFRFTIDHYEPKSVRPDLRNDYYNLMYCCDTCNQFKGDLCPPPDARRDGKRVFRPDQDLFETHYSVQGIRLAGITPTGEFTIRWLELNRLHLRKLREIRARLSKAEEYVAQGIAGLRRVHLDRFPPGLKERVYLAQRGADKTHQELTDVIDELLAVEGRSAILEEEDQVTVEDRKRRRSIERAELKALYQGSWGGRRKPEK